MLYLCCFLTKLPSKLPRTTRQTTQPNLQNVAHEGQHSYVFAAVLCHARANQSGWLHLQHELSTTIMQCMSSIIHRHLLSSPLFLPFLLRLAFPVTSNEVTNTFSSTLRATSQLHRGRFSTWRPCHGFMVTWIPKQNVKCPNVDFNSSIIACLCLNQPRKERRILGVEKTKKYIMYVHT